MYDREVGPLNFLQYNCIICTFNICTIGIYTFYHKMALFRTWGLQKNVNKFWRCIAWNWETVASCNIFHLISRLQNCSNSLLINSWKEETFSAMHIAHIISLHKGALSSFKKCQSTLHPSTPIFQINQFWEWTGDYFRPLLSGWVLVTSPNFIQCCF